MKVVRKEVGCNPQVVEIENTLEALQKEVGGYIETVTMFTDMTIVCNEEGRLMGLEHNLEFAGVDFVGTVLFVGIDGDEFCDLSDEMITYILTLNYKRTKLSKYT